MSVPTPAHHVDDVLTQVNPLISFSPKLPSLYWYPDEVFHSEVPVNGSSPSLRDARFSRVVSFCSLPKPPPSVIATRGCAIKGLNAWRSMWLTESNGQVIIPSSRWRRVTHLLSSMSTRYTLAVCTSSSFPDILAGCYPPPAPSVGRGYLLLLVS